MSVSGRRHCIFDGLLGVGELTSYRCMVTCPLFGDIGRRCESISMDKSQVRKPSSLLPRSPRLDDTSCDVIDLGVVIHRCHPAASALTGSRNHAVSFARHGSRHEVGVMHGKGCS